MGNTIMFIILAVFIIGSALMCVTTTKIMRAATSTTPSWEQLRSQYMPVALR